MLAAKLQSLSGFSLSVALSKPENPVLLSVVNVET